MQAVLPRNLCSKLMQPYLDFCAAIKCWPYLDFCATLMQAVLYRPYPRFLCRPYNIKCSLSYAINAVRTSLGFCAKANKGCLDSRAHQNLFSKLSGKSCPSLSLDLLSQLFSLLMQKWKVKCPFASLNLLNNPKWVSNPTVEKRSNPMDENQWE